MTLEADDEVGGAQILAEQRARPVRGEVEAGCGAELDRVRECRYAGGVERAERRDVNGQAARRLPEPVLGEHAAEPVARADEDDVEDVVRRAHRTCPSS